MTSDKRDVFTVDGWTRNHILVRPTDAGRSWTGTSYYVDRKVEFAVCGASTWGKRPHLPESGDKELCRSCARTLMIDTIADEEFCVKPLGECLPACNVKEN